MKNYIFSALLVVLCLTSCITAKCPGYDLNDFRLISFRQEDTLTYVSNQLDTIHLIVNNFYSKGYYTFSSYPDYECDLDTYYQTDVKNDISIKERITYGMSVQFCNDNDYRITSGSYTQKGDFMEQVSDTIINSIVCNKYYVIDLSNNRKVDAFVKIDYFGIVEFHDKINDLLWKRLPLSVGSDERF